jgi:hypothetical protein
MQKWYKAKSNLVGPCGPCSFINLSGIKGNVKKEKELSKLGRFKPFGGTEYTGFLEWGNKYNLPIRVFVTKNKVDRKMFDFIFETEKISKVKKKILMNKAIEHFNKQNERYKDKIELIKDIQAKLNSLLKEKYKVATSLAVFSKSNNKFFPHWIVAYKHEKGRYCFMDSAKSLNGYRILTDSELKSAFRKAKSMGFHPALAIIEK